MSLPHISPAKAKELIDRGAVLVDIREFDERARSRIPAARHAPLSRLDKLEIETRSAGGDFPLPQRQPHRQAMPNASRSAPTMKHSFSTAASTPGKAPDCR